jgi:tRNA(adenine34) deaminase
LEASDEVFMALALDEGRRAEQIGEVPIGAVVVCDGAVVAGGYNRREIDHDPAGHASRFARLLGSWAVGGFPTAPCTSPSSRARCVQG